jgi:hypothetical protein
MTLRKSTPVDSKTSGFHEVCMENATPIGARLANTGKYDTMKADSQEHRAIVPDKLRQFLTNPAAMHSGETSDERRARTKQIQQLGGAILDRGRIVSQLYSTSAGRRGERISACGYPVL